MLHPIPGGENGSAPGAPFQPIAPAVYPITGRAHFPDRLGGRIVILNDDPATLPIGATPDQSV